MKPTLEKLWNQCYAEECSAIDTDEERILTKKAIRMREMVNKLLTEPERDAIEKYIEILWEIQGYCVKKAFFKGCEFATSFLVETGNIGNIKADKG